MNIRGERRTRAKQTVEELHERKLARDRAYEVANKEKRRLKCHNYYLKKKELKQ